MKTKSNKSTPTSRKFYKINQNIEAKQLRVINNLGEMIGVLSKSEALEMAKKEEKDLVLISANAKPPVAKIIDFKKFLYQEEKKQQEAKKGVSKGGTKDVQLGLNTGKADFDRTLKKAQTFLNEGNQVRVNLKLKGRESSRPNLAIEMINNFITQLQDVNISKEPRLEGKVVRAVLSRKK